MFSVISRQNEPDDRRINKLDWVCITSVSFINSECKPYIFWKILYSKQDRDANKNWFSLLKILTTAINCNFITICCGRKITSLQQLWKVINLSVRKYFHFELLTMYLHFLNSELLGVKKNSLKILLQVWEGGSFCCYISISQWLRVQFSACLHPLQLH